MKKKPAKSKDLKTVIAESHGDRPVHLDGRNVMVGLDEWVRAWGIGSDGKNELVSPVAGVPLPDKVLSEIVQTGNSVFREWEGCANLAKYCLENGSVDFGPDSPMPLEVFLHRMAQWQMQQAVISGFYLACLRYADHLKTSVEATAVLEHRRQTAQKNGKARTKKVAPTHKAIQRRFRQLRKESPKKTVRYLRVAEEFEMSDRHVARIVEGID
jgi:hypothetical protein